MLVVLALPRGDMNKLTCFADGSCYDNGKPTSKGGWAFILLAEDGSTTHEAVGAVPGATNNSMELMAVIEALKSLTEPTEVLVKTDSLYVIDAFVKNWIVQWKKHDYKLKNGEQRKNEILWRELDVLVAFHTIKWEWVKGHSGVFHNEYVDMRAYEAWNKFQHPVNTRTYK